MYDVIIIGAGPGGLSAAIYASRMGLNTLVLEKFSPGGAITQSSEIENYPGVCETVDGLTFMQCWPEQAKKFGAKILSEEVIKLEKIDNKFIIKTRSNEYTSLSVILATGSVPKRGGFKNEEKYIGKGVSYCAVCDGFFYKNLDVAVIGGGDSALEEALYLSNIARKVYLIHRRDKFRASPLIIEKVLKKENIEVLYNSEVEEVIGEEFVTSLKLKDNRVIKVDGVFVFVGHNINSELVKDLVLLNNKGEVKVDLDMKSSLEGLYAIGDVRENSVKQVVTSAGDGATAALNVVKFLKNLKD